MFCLPDIRPCVLDHGQVTKHFRGISLVMYLVYYNYSNAGPECQARETGSDDKQKSNKVYLLWRLWISEREV